MDLAQEMKPVLTARLAKLEHEIANIDTTLREPDAEDFEDRATENEGDEVLEDLGKAAQAEIVQIKAALQRIEEGTYGECATCGKEIAEARLRAVPHTPQCINCAK